MSFTNLDSSSFKTAVDEHITGGKYHKDELQVKCPKCQCSWVLEGSTEYGMFIADNEDKWICKDCDVEAES